MLFLLQNLSAKNQPNNIRKKILRWQLSALISHEIFMSNLSMIVKNKGIKSKGVK